MIDWVQIRIPKEYQIKAGSFLVISPDGEVEKAVMRHLSVRGSYDAHVLLKTYEGDLIIDGNPQKWFQGHNWHGSSDLAACVYQWLPLISEAMGVDITDAPLEESRLLRVDVATSFDFGSNEQVNQTLKFLEQSATMPYRGKGNLIRGSTLYFGQNSRHDTLKLYNKAQESLVHKMPVLQEGILRAEVTLRSRKLQELGLSHLCNWTGETAMTLLTSYLDKLHISEQVLTAAHQLSPRLFGAYQMWRAGVDLRTVLHIRTFQRYRRDLKAYGVDIATVPTPDQALELEERRVNVPQVKDWKRWEPARILN